MRIFTTYWMLLVESLQSIYIINIRQHDHYIFIVALIMITKYATHDVSHMNHSIDGNSGSITVDFLTNDTFIEESVLSTTDKKRKIENIYMSCKWLEESEYEVIKTHRIIRNKIVCHIKFCKGQVSKKPIYNFDKKTSKVLPQGKSHETPDLTICSGYEYDIMKEVGVYKNNNTLSETALWWKTYSGHSIDEIRNLNSRINAGRKKGCIKRKLLFYCECILYCVSHLKYHVQYYWQEI